MAQDRGESECAARVQHPARRELVLISYQSPALAFDDPRPFTLPSLAWTPNLTLPSRSPRSVLAEIDDPATLPVNVQTDLIECV
jgi:hypothetical protein